MTNLALFLALALSPAAVMAGPAGSKPGAEQADTGPAGLFEAGRILGPAVETTVLATEHHPPARPVRRPLALTRAGDAGPATPPG
jgi:hypothetical protein